MIDAEQAWRRVLAHTQPMSSGPRPILEALHHYLAGPVCADRDIPARDRAAMDGYAVRADDLSAVPTSLKVIDEVAAGSPGRPAVASGECVRIFTGANVPPGADTVVMVEDTEPEVGTPEGERVRFLCPVVKGQHIFRQGENARTGDVLVPVGTRLNATHIGLCASAGCECLDVHGRPRVTILTTGAELREAGESVASHEIRDSNGPMLAAVLAQHHFPCVARASAPDDVEMLAHALSKALDESDVVLATGGVSVGKYDLVPDAIRNAGGKMVYHGVRIKPGKPQLFAVFPADKHVFGLPGNPLSVMTGLQEFALPSLRRRAGCPVGRCRPLLRLPLAAEIRAKGKRQQYVLGRMVCGQGVTMVKPVPSAGSADLAAAGRADGAIIVPNDVTQLAAGTTVDFRPWESLQ